MACTGKLDSHSSDSASSRQWWNRICLRIQHNNSELTLETRFFELELTNFVAPNLGHTGEARMAQALVRAVQVDALRVRATQQVLAHLGALVDVPALAIGLEREASWTTAEAHQIVGHGALLILGTGCGR